MIWIDPYYRIRFSKVEYVRAHWRKLPGGGSSSAAFGSLPNSSTA